MRKIYTSEELLEADMADLEADIIAAERDGLVSYAEQCRRRLKAMRATIDAGKCSSCGQPSKRDEYGYWIPPTGCPACTVR